MSGDTSNVEDNQKIPFQSQTFLNFVGLVGRFFYDDACIVLLDFLAREQKSFLEADLRDKLGWRDALIQQKLYLLEKQMLVIQDTAANKGPRSPSHWRISHQIYGAVQWRYQQVLDRLTKLVDDAHRQHEFECSKCQAKYTALDAAACNRALDDEHPLCSKCGSQLKPSEFEETKQQAKEKRARALQQLQSLGQSLVRIGNMEVPVFPQYTKKDDVKDQSADLDTPPPVQSMSAPQQNVQQPSTSPASSSTGAASSSEPSEDPKEQVTRDFQVRLGNAATTASSSRVIPWFKPGGVPVGKGEVFGQSASTPPAPMKISFGLKTLNKSSTIRPLAPTGFGVTGDAPMPTPPTVQPKLLPVMSAISAPVGEDELEIEIKHIGKKLKISEITEDIEQRMTDEEYKIYYNASELRL